jgi:hypothetical protein
VLERECWVPKCQWLANRCFQRASISSPSTSNHAFDFLFAHFSIFEYPGHTKNTWQEEVEVNLTRTRKSIDNKNWAFLVGIKSSASGFRFSCLQIMNTSMREAAERNLNESTGTKGSSSTTEETRRPPSEETSPENVVEVEKENY